MTLTGHPRRLTDEAGRNLGLTSADGDTDAESRSGSARQASYLPTYVGYCLNPNRFEVGIRMQYHNKHTYASIQVSILLYPVFFFFFCFFSFFVSVAERNGGLNGWSGLAQCKGRGARLNVNGVDLPVSGLAFADVNEGALMLAMAIEYAIELELEQNNS